MTEKGVRCKVDKMGRVVIPKGVRQQLNIESEKDSVELKVKGEEIILKKYRPACFFCDTLDEIVNYEGYNICVNCIEKLKNLKDELE